jgi:methyl-accepting chemotaxis protein
LFKPKIAWKLPLLVFALLTTANVAMTNRHALRLRQRGEAGDLPGAILSKVGTIAAGMSDVAPKAVEQARGLSDLNASLTHLDESSQRNTATREQTTLARQDLTQDTKILNETMGILRANTKNDAPRAVA